MHLLSNSLLSLLLFLLSFVIICLGSSVQYVSEIFIFTRTTNPGLVIETKTKKK